MSPAVIRSVVHRPARAPFSPRQPAPPMTTTTLLTTPPDATEYDPYYGRYIARVPAGDVVHTLDTQLADTLALIDTFGDARAEHRYAPGKWTVKEVVGHLADVERIFAYRALRIGRGDATPLPGFDENAYVAQADFGRRTLGDLAREFEFVRRATVALFAGMTDEALARRGTANGQAITPRALAYIVAGHERHHAVLLRERYS